MSTAAAEPPTLLVRAQAGRKFFEWLRNAKLCLDLGVKAFIEQDCPNAFVFLDPKRILARRSPAPTPFPPRLKTCTV